VPPAEVQSPTYTLVREHRAADGGRFVHLDLYRLDPEEAAELGLDEVLAAPGVKVVEWAERLAFTPPGAVALLLVRSAAGRQIWEIGPGAEVDNETEDIEEEDIR
jgi:tRNA threonylcarbamoyladenosine biosynthesis protein TsaE